MFIIALVHVCDLMTIDSSQKLYIRYNFTSVVFQHCRLVLVLVEDIGAIVHDGVEVVGRPVIRPGGVGHCRELWFEFVDNSVMENLNMFISIGSNMFVKKAQSVHDLVLNCASRHTSLSMGLF